MSHADPKHDPGVEQAVLRLDESCKIEYLAAALDCLRSTSPAADEEGDLVIACEQSLDAVVGRLEIAVGKLSGPSRATWRSAKPRLDILLGVRPNSALSRFSLAPALLDSIARLDVELVISIQQPWSEDED